MVKEDFWEDEALLNVIILNLVLTHHSLLPSLS